MEGNGLSPQLTLCKTSELKKNKSSSSYEKSNLLKRKQEVFRGTRKKSSSANVCRAMLCVEEIMHLIEKRSVNMDEKHETKSIDSYLRGSVRKKSLVLKRSRK